jgi:hypothetical protein
MKICKSLAPVDERFIPACERVHDRYAHGMDPDLEQVKLPFLWWNFWANVFFGDEFGTCPLTGGSLAW